MFRITNLENESWELFYYIGTYLIILNITLIILSNEGMDT